MTRLSPAFRHPREMSDKPASLLTKSQRERVAEGFRSLDGAKRRRDRQRVRERVAAGVDDFGHLVEYPDDQLETAFDDHDDDEVERALADVRLVNGRIRLLRGIGRDAVVTRVRDRLRTVEADERTLSAVDLRTREEVTREVRAELEAEYEPDGWKRRSDLALKLGTLLALPEVLLVPVPFGTVPPAVDGAVVFVALVFGGPALAFVLAVVAARTIKHDLVPALRSIADDPVGAVRRAWNRL